MSEIDCYKFECIGIVECPITHWYDSNDTISPHHIPIYRIDEDALDADSFKAKAGDLLFGGGSGETPALQISIPEAIQFYTGYDGYIDSFDSFEELVRAFWNWNDAFFFGEGYIKIGWNPKIDITDWLASHILAFILREYPEVYSRYQGSSPLDQSGNICRKPTVEEKNMWVPRNSRQDSI